jgi:hypothetical protein
VNDILSSAYCAEAVEAELCVCREGLKLALARSELPIIIESDCAQAIAATKEPSMDRSTKGYQFLAGYPTCYSLGSTLGFLTPGGSSGEYGYWMQPAANGCPGLNFSGWVATH